MKLLVAAGLLVALSLPRPASACPAPPPTRTSLELVTAADAVIPPDGALLVRRAEVPWGTPTVDDLTARTTDGAKVTLESEPLGGDLERWRMSPPGTTDVELVDSAGKVVRVVHRGAATAAPLPTPKLRRFSSTVSRGMRPPPQGILGGTVTVTLAASAPPTAEYLAIVEGAGVDAFPVLLFPLVAGQREYQQVSYTRKSCSGGPPTILAGARLSVSWIDALGRRSPVRKVTVTRARE